MSSSAEPFVLNDQIQLFLKNYFKSSAYTVYQLAGDASARKYYRIIHESMSYVLMVWEPFNQGNYPFLDVLRHFDKSKINVPTVLGVDGNLGVILLEDLGDLTLERKFWESSNFNQSWPFYQKSIEQIVMVHRDATNSRENSICKTTQFDTAMFVWEMNYATEHLLTGLLKFKFEDSIKAELDKAFHTFCEILHNEPKVICHRDYHSRNLMIKLDKVCLIDFQDARMGPVQYDLVSLIRDSYVDINDESADKILNDYLSQHDVLKVQNISKDYFMRIFEIQSLQRCFKACGSFASFANARDDRRYLKYLPQTLKTVMRSLTQLPEYRILTNILIDSGALEKNYERM
jgi:N-acetylmuramate 1-kinase